MCPSRNGLYSSFQDYRYAKNHLLVIAIQKYSNLLSYDRVNIKSKMSRFNGSQCVSANATTATVLYTCLLISTQKRQLEPILVKD